MGLLDVIFDKSAPKKTISRWAARDRSLSATVDTFFDN